MELPVTGVVALMLFAFWTCVPMLVIGLFLGCCNSFRGEDFDKAVEYMKKDRRGSLIRPSLWLQPLTWR